MRTFAQPTQIAIPSWVWPSAGSSSSTWSPDVEPARHGQRLDVAERQRPRALDVVLLVELAQLAGGHARLGPQPGRRGLRDAERDVGEHEAREQVVEVRVGGEQAGQAPAHLREELADAVELLLVDRRVDDERLVPRVQERAGRLPLDARGDDDVPVQGQDLHGGGALEPEEADGLEERLDLLGGLLHPASRVSLRRLTQMTGTLSFRSGSTSW
jgi:hypothetical protein